MDAVMDSKVIEDITTQFQALVSVVPLRAVRNEADYEKAVSVLNQLLDAGAADETSPLAGLVDTLGAFIADYEDVQHPAQVVSPGEALRFLMTQHGLMQSELPEVGSQGVVSEILRGKRELNVRQIKALAERFHVPAAVFI